MFTGKMGFSRQTVLGIAFLLGLISSLLVGMDLSFNVYALSLKKTFNFSQTEVELVASMGTIGLALSFILRLLLNAIGYPGTYLTVWLLTVVSSILYSIAAHYGKTVTMSPALICCVQLTLATGLSMMFVAITSFAVQVFSKQHSGKIIGLYCAVMALAKIFFIALVKVLNLDLMAFFASLAAMFAIVFGTCLIILLKVFQTIPDENTSHCKSGTKIKNENTQLLSTSNMENSSHTDNKNEKNSLNENSKTPCKDVQTNRCLIEYDNDNNNMGKSTDDSGFQYRDMLKYPSVHALFWPSTLFFAATFTCLNDLTEMGLAIGVQDPLAPVYVTSLSIFTTRIVCGLIFDHFQSQRCGLIMILCGTISTSIAMGLGLFHLNAHSMFAISALLGISQGVGFTIPASITMLNFGPECCEFFTIAFFVVLSVFQTVFQLISGYSYDSTIRVHGIYGIYCYGPSCFFKTYVLSFIVGLINGLFAIGSLLYVSLIR